MKLIRLVDGKLHTVITVCPPHCALHIGRLSDMAAIRRRPAFSRRPLVRQPLQLWLLTVYRRSFAQITVCADNRGQFNFNRRMILESRICLLFDRSDFHKSVCYLYQASGGGAFACTGDLSRNGGLAPVVQLAFVSMGNVCVSCMALCNRLFQYCRQLWQSKSMTWLCRTESKSDTKSANGPQY